MNNAFISLEPESGSREDTDTRLQGEEAKLLRVIEAVQVLQKSREWSTLKTDVFEHLALSLERELRTEAKKEDPDSKKLNRLSGELKWADRFSNLDKFENDYRVKLQNIRLQLHGKTK